MRLNQNQFLLGHSSLKETYRDLATLLSGTLFTFYKNTAVSAGVAKLAKEPTST